MRYIVAASMIGERRRWRVQICFQVLFLDGSRFFNLGTGRHLSLARKRYLAGPADRRDLAENLQTGFDHARTAMAGR